MNKRRRQRQLASQMGRRTWASQFTFTLQGHLTEAGSRFFRSLVGPDTRHTRTRMKHPDWPS